MDNLTNFTRGQSPSKSYEKSGLIHILCGDGKGKTTSAIGMAIRALGRGKRVVLVQFLKGVETGEINVLKNMDNITIIRADRAKSFDYKNIEGLKESHNEMLKKAISVECDILILDEIAACCNYGYIDKAIIDDYIFNKPEGVELVLTGRNPDKKWIEVADYVSEIKKIKHPYDKGIVARGGIEL